MVSLVKQKRRGLMMLVVLLLAGLVLSCHLARTPNGALSLALGIVAWVVITAVCWTVAWLLVVSLARAGW
jgi:hypothetical protein